MHLRELRRLPPERRVVADDHLGVGPAGVDAVGHLLGTVDGDEVLAVRDRQVDRPRLAADLGRHSVHDRQARPERIADDGELDHEIIEPPRVVQERKEHVEHDLRVGLPADAAAQELRHARHQSVANRIELPHGAGLGEEPLAVTKRMCVLGAERPHRGRAYVPEDDVGAHVGAQLRHVDLVAVVDRAAAHEHLAGLIEPDTPPERLPASLHPQYVRLEAESSAGEIGAISQEAEQTCHRGSSPYPHISASQALT